MPYTIVFDTNYLRSLSQNEYLAGRLPQLLDDQLRRATARGDSVAIPNTVRMETNKWLADKANSDRQRLANARTLLENNGFTIAPPPDVTPPDPDIVAIIQAKYPGVTVLHPTLTEYLEAERRTSYRLPPHPKNPEHEEMRDRLIWCQLLTHAEATRMPILIVSNDHIFKNGANSEEGMAFHIEHVEDNEELSQRLNARPAHIQALIDEVLLFAPKLLEIGINLRPDSIELVENVRKVNRADASTLKRFSLRTTAVHGLEPLVDVMLVSMGSIPIKLSIHQSEGTTVITRELSEDEKRGLEAERSQSLLTTYAELGRIVRS